MTDKAGSGDSKVRKGLCNSVTSEQRPEQKEAAWRSNIPDRGENRKQILGREDVLSKPEGQEGGQGGRCPSEGERGRDLGQTWRALGFLLRDRGTHSGFGGVETERSGRVQECTWPTGDHHHGGPRRDDAETSSRGGRAEGRQAHDAVCRQREGDWDQAHSEKERVNEDAPACANS